jgi:hypothetical protein
MVAYPRATYLLSSICSPTLGKPLCSAGSRYNSELSLKRKTRLVAGRALQFPTTVEPWWFHDSYSSRGHVSHQRRNYATILEEKNGPLSNDKPCTFPFPSHPTPTPHEIFHLPRGSSQGQIKSRCESFQSHMPLTLTI